MYANLLYSGPTAPISASPISFERVTAPSPIHIMRWFESVAATWTGYKIDVQDVYNMDETGFQMGHSQKETVVFDRRTGPPSAVTTGNTNLIPVGDTSFLIATTNT